MTCVLHTEQDHQELMSERPEGFGACRVWSRDDGNLARGADASDHPPATLKTNGATQD